MIDQSMTLQEAERHANLSIRLSRMVRDAVDEGNVEDARSIFNDAAAPEWALMTSRTKTLLDLMQHVDASYHHALKKLGAAEAGAETEEA